MAAGLATLRELKENPPYARLEQIGRIIGAGLQEAGRVAGVPHHFARVGSMWTLFFAPEPVVDYDTAKKSDTKWFSTFFWAMLECGVYLPCSQFEACFISAAMTEEDARRTVAAGKESIK